MTTLPEEVNVPLEKVISKLYNTNPLVVQNAALLVLVDDLREELAALQAEVESLRAASSPAE